MTPLESQSETPLSQSAPADLAPPRRTPVWLWGVLLLLALGGGGFLLWRTVFSRGGPPPGMMMGMGPLPVELEEVTVQTIEDASEFVGILDAQQGIALRPEAEGRITEIAVSSGDTVEAGQLIAVLSPDRNEAEVRAAEANENVFRAARTSAQAQVESLRADRIRAEAEVALQQAEFERFRGLTAEGASSQQQLDQVRRNLEVAQAELAALDRQISAAEASVDEASAAFNQAQQQTEAVRSDLDDKRVVAPIGGIVGNIPVKLGDYVEVTDTLTTITQNQRLDLELAVPVEYRDRLQTGVPVEIMGSRDGEAIATGSISFVSPQVNVQSQSVLAEATFVNTSGLLQDDQRVIARIIWDESPGVLVPATAISRLGGQAFVFVASQQPNEETGETQLVAEQRLVALGDIQGNSYQVESGLEPGENIVVSGILNLSDGAPIAPPGTQPPGPGGPPPES
ncbi:MAG: efflux RND transporter periplasmic adaptor subunit [Synechococcales bacterium]|nr:efflux RND transporter periplasmic adaptor subunit [Synechococcales bacterium]